MTRNFIMRKLFIFSLLALVLASCGEYQRVQKSPDPDVKFDYAKRAFEEGRYVQAYTLLKDVVAVFKGRRKPKSRFICSVSATMRTRNILMPQPISKATTSVIPKAPTRSLRASMPATPTILIPPSLSSTSRAQSRQSRSFRDFLTTSPAANASLSPKTLSLSFRTS